MSVKKQKKYTFSLNSEKGFNMSFTGTLEQIKIEYYYWLRNLEKSKVNSQTVDESNEYLTFLVEKFYSRQNQLNLRKPKTNIVSAKQLSENWNLLIQNAFKVLKFHERIWFLNSFFDFGRFGYKSREEAKLNDWRPTVVVTFEENKD